MIYPKAKSSDGVKIPSQLSFILSTKKLNNE